MPPLHHYHHHINIHERINYVHGNLRLRNTIPRRDLNACMSIGIPIQNIFRHNHVVLNHLPPAPYVNLIVDELPSEISFHHYYAHLHYHYIEENQVINHRLFRNHLPSHQLLADIQIQYPYTSLTFHTHVFYHHRWGWTSFKRRR